MWLAFLSVSIFAALVAGASIDVLRSAVQNVDDCPSCLALLGALQSIAMTGDDPFITTLTSLCIGLGVRLRYSFLVSIDVLYLM
jgi:hypothetical protein